MQPFQILQLTDFFGQGGELIFTKDKVLQMMQLKNCCGQGGELISTKDK